MKSRPMKSFVLILSALALSALILCGPATADAQIKFLPLPGLTWVKNTTFHYDAGSVDVIRTPHLEKTFTVENASSQPLTIAGLRGSCGCETLLLSQHGVRLPTARLAPGEQAEIHLTVQLHPGQSGPVRKYLWVDGPAVPGTQASPLATLEMDMTLRQAVIFTPSYLNFGKVEAGADAPQTLTVSLDGDLLPTASPAADPILPSLRSANPDVRVAPIGGPQRTDQNGHPVVRQTYRITLSPDVPAGRLSGELRFAAMPQSTAPDPFGQVSVSVAAQVAGDLDCLPASVFFGSLPAGTAVSRSVVLSTASPQSTSALTVVSSVPWLKAVLTSAPDASRHHLLQITLTPNAPLGSVQEKITVTLGQSARLDIPVVAELTR